MLTYAIGAVSGWADLLLGLVREIRELGNLRDGEPPLSTNAAGADRGAGREEFDQMFEAVCEELGAAPPTPHTPQTPAATAPDRTAEEAETAGAQAAAAAARAREEASEAEAQVYDQVVQILRCVVIGSLQRRRVGWCVLREALAALSRLRQLDPLAADAEERCLAVRFVLRLLALLVQKHRCLPLHYWYKRTDTDRY